MATYYVSTDGSDGNDGTSIGTAKATPAAGVALLSAGDTLEILPGVYEIDATIVVTVPEVTIRGYQGMMPTLHRLNNTVQLMMQFTSTAINCTIEDLDIFADRTGTGGGTINGITVENFSSRGHFQALGCRFRSCSHATITGGNNVFLVVKGCEINDSAFNNAIASGSGGGCHIEGNYYHSSNAQFLNIHFNHRGAIVIGNVVTSGTGLGVLAVDGCVIRGNTFVGITNDGIQIGNNEANTRRAVIENNIICNCGRYGINAQWTGGPVRTPLIGHNAFFNNTSGNYNGVLPGDGDVLLTEDPFVDSANGDYSLTPAAQKLLTYGTPSTWPGSTTPDSRLAIGAWQPSGGGISWPLIRRISAMGDLRFSPSGATY